MSSKWLKNPSSYKRKIKKKNQPLKLMKKLLTQWELKRKTNKLVDKKTLKTNDKNKRKNQQIEINEKPPNLVGIEEEN